MGAWIETDLAPLAWRESPVAPHVGAWIETYVKMGYDFVKWVAPHVGAWIETIALCHGLQGLSRAPRGRVD